MRYWDAFFAFLVAMAVATVLTPFANKLARRVGAVATPSDRGLAERETPALGGLAILAGVLVAAAFWLPPTINLHHTAGTAPGTGGTVHTWAILAGACLITLVGAIDDAHPLRPQWKLLGQIAAAVIAVVVGGAVVTDVTIPFLGTLQLPNTGGVLTVIWLVGPDERREPLGRRRRARGRAVHDRRGRVRDHRVRPRHQRRRRARGADRRGRARLPVPQLPAGFVVHGRRRGESARLPARGGRGHRFGEDGRGRRPDGAADRPGGAVPRHRLRRRQAAQVQTKAVGGGRQPLPPPDGADGIQPAPDGRLPVRLDADARGRRGGAAVRAVLEPPRRLPPGLDAGDGGDRAGGARGQRLPDLRARDPEVQEPTRAGDPHDGPGHQRARDRRAGASARSRPGSSSGWVSWRRRLDPPTTG